MNSKSKRSKDKFNFICVLYQFRECPVAKIDILRLSYIYIIYINTHMCCMYPQFHHGVLVEDAVLQARRDFYI